MRIELRPPVRGAADERLAFTAREAAAMLAVSERTLWQLTRDGKVRARKVGRLVRYYRPDLVAFMEQQENHGQHQQ
jgi:excisionase family DNA binding protein